MSTEDEIFEQIKAAGEALKPGLWLADDLDTLHAIASDIVGLEAKAEIALTGVAGVRPPIMVNPPLTLPHPVIQPIKPPPLLHTTPLAPHTLTPVAVHPATTPTPVATHTTPATTHLSPAAKFQLRGSLPLAQVAPTHISAVATALPHIDISRLMVIHPVPPDPARAAMYRKAADRALDSAANLALLRMQATAAQAQSLSGGIISRIWTAIQNLVPGLHASATATASTPNTATTTTTTTTPTQ